MPGNSALILVSEYGWRGGLRNLLRAELGGWFRTNTWWIQSLIWVGVINLILAGILWTDEAIDVLEAAALLSLFMGLFPTIAIIIIMQDTVVGEKEAGTAAWVMSKPVSRSSFILAKLIANSLGVLVTMILLPGVVAFVQLSIYHGSLMDPVNFLRGLGVIYINMLFYLTLTLMLGTFFNHRGPVIGIPLVRAFGQQMILGLLPFLVQVLPWTLVVPFGDVELPIAAAFIQGTNPHSMTPFYSTLFFVILFSALALWRFEREEF
jgi:ABC-2 type transport system permease protein